MWDSVVDVGRRAAAIVGAGMNAAGIALFPAPLDIRADYAAAAIVTTGTVAMWWALRDRDDQIKAKDAELDNRAAIAEGLQEFHDRLFEGTEVLRSILPWPPFARELSPGERESEAVRRTEAYAKLVAEWNQACLVTVQTRLRHRKWLLDRPVDYAPAISSKVPLRVIRLREEVREKIERMNTLQLELESQSRRAAIS